MLQVGKKMIVWVLDHTLGLVLVQRALCGIFGNAQRGVLLPVIRYRPRYMVLPGETAILVGIFSARTVQNFLDAVGAAGRVVVIEANPHNVARLENQLGARPNLLFVNKAVWTERRTVTFIASNRDDTQGYNRIKTSAIAEYPYHMESDVSEIRVEGDRLTEILTSLNLSRLDHINLTCNGAELGALNSILELVPKYPGVRIYANTQAPQPFEEYVHDLKANGFKHYIARVQHVRNQKIRLKRVYAYVSRNTAPSKDLSVT